MKNLPPALRSGLVGFASTAIAGAVVLLCWPHGDQPAVSPAAEDQHVLALRLRNGSRAQLSLVDLSAFTRDRGCVPASLVPLLRSEERWLRARACAALRVAWGLPLPAGLQRELCRDPSPGVRRHAAPPAWDAINLLEVFLPSALEDDVPVLPLIPAGWHVSAAHGERSWPDLQEYAHALVRAGLRQPIDSYPPSMLGSAERNWDEDRLAVRMFVVASRLSASAQGIALAHAAAAREPRLVQRILTGLLQVGRVRAEVAREHEGALLDLLGHFDPKAAQLALELAAVAVRTGETPRLRQRILATAGRELRARLPELALGPSEMQGCGTGGPRPGRPMDLSSSVVLVAAELGDGSLFAPLLRELQSIAMWDRIAAAGPIERSGREDQHLWFVLACVSELAPVLSPEDAASLHRLIVELPRSGPLFGTGRRATWTRLELEKLTWRLFPRVPEHLLPWYEQRHRQPVHRESGWPQLLWHEEWFTPSRARTLLVWSGDEVVRGLLYLHAPDLLIQHWAAGAASPVGEPWMNRRDRAAARCLATMMSQRTERTLLLIRRERWPRKMLETAVSELSGDDSVLRRLLLEVRKLRARDEDLTGRLAFVEQALLRRIEPLPYDCGTSEAALACELGVAAESTHWTWQVEARVLRATDHAGASVRAAAYRALRSRDLATDGLAWFRFEAAFDPAPEVRALVD